MGKKSGSKGGEQEKARAFVLKVDMHCSCKGCVDKIRAAAKDITALQGIEGWDQSGVESKGELRLVATADPEKLQQRLHKATRKHVDLIFPKDKQADKDTTKQAAAGNNNNNKDAAAQALLNSLQLQGQQNQLLGWNAHGGAGGYQSASYAYPSWPLQQQPDPYAAAYSAYPAASWGTYPPVAPHGYGGWHGHGY